MSNLAAGNARSKRFFRSCSLGPVIAHMSQRRHRMEPIIGVTTDSFSRPDTNLVGKFAE